MFIINGLIGEGGFGKVMTAMMVQTQNWYAIKEINKIELTKHKTGIEMIFGELKALKKVDHPFIISLHFAFQNRDCCYIVLDLKTGGDLRYYLRKKLSFEEKDVAFYVSCISSALRHIHSKNIIHRDIKPENIILDERGYPHLADFGVAHVNKDDAKSLTCFLASGTKQYLAPEVFTKSHTHGPEVDYWSLGVVAYELLFSKRPFEKHCPIPFITYLEKALQTKQSQLEKEKLSSTKNSKLTSSFDSVTTTSDKSPDSSSEFYSPLRKSFANNLTGNLHSTFNFPTIAEESSKEMLTNNTQSSAFNHRMTPNRSSFTNISRISNDSRVLTKYREAYQTYYEDALDDPKRCSSPVLNRDKEVTVLAEEHWLVDSGELPVHLVVPIPVHTSWLGSVSPNCTSLLRGLFDVRPSHRLGSSMEELMQHPWLKENKVSNWTELESKKFEPFFKPGKKFLKDGFAQYQPAHEKLIDENNADNFTDTDTDNDISDHFHASPLRQSHFKDFHYVSPLYEELEAKSNKRSTMIITNTSTTTTSIKVSASTSSIESPPTALPVILPAKKNILNNSTDLIKNTAKKVFSYSISGSSKRDGKILPSSKPVSNGVNSKIK